MSAYSRHGRPTAGSYDRPRGYPTNRVPDIGRPAHYPPIAKRSPWLPSKWGMWLGWVIVLCVVLPCFS